MKINIVNSWETTTIDGEIYDLYTAYSADNPRLKGTGVDITSAIGTLLRNHQRRLGVRIKVEPPKNYAREMEPHFAPIADKRSAWLVNDPEFNGDNKNIKTVAVRHTIVVHEGFAANEVIAKFDDSPGSCTQSTPVQAIGDLILANGRDHGINVVVNIEETEDAAV